MAAAGLIDRLPRICLAQAARANPMVRSYQEGYAPLEYPLTGVRDGDDVEILLQRP